MAEIRHTRIRYIIGSTPQDVETAINRLPFRVELKSGILPIPKGFIVSFVIPDIDQIDFASIDLRDA